MRCTYPPYSFNWFKEIIIFMRLIATGVFLGTFSLQFLSSLPSNLILFSLLLIALFVFFLAFRVKYLHDSIDASTIKFLSVFFISILLSFSYASLTAKSIIDSRLETALEGEDLIVEGIIANIPQHQQDRWRFYLDVQRVKLLGQDDGDIKRVIKLKGKIKLSWYHQKKIPQKMIHAGQKWRFQVRLKQPNGFLNQGGLDYEKWLFTHRIKATGYIRHSVENRLLAPAVWTSIDYQRQQLSTKIKQSLESHGVHKDSEATAIILALGVANRNGISPQQWRLFQQTGTSHLIAISGLHIGVIAGFGYLLIAVIWWLFPSLYQQIPVRIAGVFLAIALASLYAILAGFTLPTQRSLIMVIGIVIALVQRQQVRSVSILSFAIILVLFIDPLAPLGASFWLSFTAVILILLYGNKQLRKPRLSLLWLQLILSFAMFPLTIFFFGSASFISPVANLIAIPWVTLIIVPLILLAMLLFLIAPALSAYLLEFVSFNIEYLSHLLQWLDSFPLTTLNFHALPTSLLLVMMLSLLFLLLPKGFPAKWLGFLLLIPVFSYQPQQVAQGEFKYSLLDVGQGLASLIETQHHRLLYDTGPKSSYHFDTGKLVVLPFLQSKGIGHLDKMVLSHRDIDHYGGTLALLKQISVSEIISSNTHFLKKHAITACQAGQKWQWDNVHFEFLHPDAKGNFSGADISDNNRSCVLRISNQYHSLLLTADIEKKVEQFLLTTQADKLKSEVLLIPHHGSKTSSSLKFIATVNPSLALNSSGYRNRYKHPAKKIMQHYRAMQIPVIDSVNKGEITLLFPADNKPLVLKSYRNENLRFWHRKNNND